MKDAAVSGVDRREPTGGDGGRKKKRKVEFARPTRRRRGGFEVDENNRATEWSDRRRALTTLYTTAKSPS